MLEAIEHFMVDTLGTYGYLAVFLLMTAESSGVPFPSEVTMAFGGFLASRGELNFLFVAAVGTIGNVVGAGISYTIGRVGGRPLAERLGRFVLVRPHDLDKAEDWFRRRGDMTVLICRVIPVLRAFVSFPAGMAKMPVGRFLFFTFIGTIPWTLGLTAIGFFFGENWETILRYGEPVSWLILAAGIIAAAWWIRHRLQHIKAEREAAGE